MILNGNPATMSAPSQSRKSRIILGLMTFGPDPSRGARVAHLEGLTEALNIFQERGYNELDTARGYIGGKQEGWTRDAGWKQRGMTIATKVYPTPAGTHKPEIITERFETSLRELGTECVDIAYLHAADRSVPFAETLDAMDKLHKAGKFKALGLSNFTAFEVAEVVMTCKYNNWVRPTVYQGMYNFIMRSIEPELVPACRRYGLDIVVYNPIAGGLFKREIQNKDQIPAEGRFSDVWKGWQSRDRYYRDSTFEALGLVDNVLKDHGITMIEAGLRWIMHHSALKIKDGKDGVIIGASEVGHVAENLAYLEKGPLPQDIVEALDAAWAVAKGGAANYWHLDLKYTYDTKASLFGKESGN